MDERDPSGFGRIGEDEAGIGGIRWCADRAAVQAEGQGNRGEERDRNDCTPNGLAWSTRHYHR